MHERSLIRALLRQIEDLAAHHPGSSVQTIRVRIGEFSGVEPDLLASAFDDLVQDTPFRNASLDLAQVPLEGLCKLCGSRFLIERFRFRCDLCGSEELTLHGGEEMLLESVTMEDAEP